MLEENGVILTYKVIVMQYDGAILFNISASLDNGFSVTISDLGKFPQDKMIVNV